MLRSLTGHHWDSQAREQTALCLGSGLLRWSTGIFQQLKLAHHRPLSLGVYLSTKFDSWVLGFFVCADRAKFFQEDKGLINFGLLYLRNRKQERNFSKFKAV